VLELFERFRAGLVFVPCERLRYSKRRHQKCVDIGREGETVRPIRCSPLSWPPRHKAEFLQSSQSTVDGGLAAVDRSRDLSFGGVADKQRCEDGRAGMHERVNKTGRPTVHLLFNIE
jgi:hypothetical protein